MIEVFITDIRSELQAEKAVGLLADYFPGLKAEIDLQQSKHSYPCGHSILRIEGVLFQPESIKVKMETAGYRCEILEDKICGPS